MTVSDLIEMLQDCPPEDEVRLLCQPSWPFEYSVDRVVRDAEMPETEEPEDATADRAITFLLEGEQLQYGNREVWQ